MEDGVNRQPIGSKGIEAMAMKFDEVGYVVDDPKRGIEGLMNDRRVNNPVRRDKPYGR